MGPNVSVQRTRAGADYAEDVINPIAFHEVHGDNIRLTKSGTVACRAEGFCKGITFSNRPIKVNEHVYVKFLDISTSWSGALRIGFTANNPSSFRSSLPRYACPDLTNKPGNWAKAVAEVYAKEGSIIFYYVDESGDVHYGVDKQDRGVFFSGVNTSAPLWALLDVYGNTRTVEIFAPHSFRSDELNAIVNVRNIVCNSRLPIQLMKNSDFSSNVFSGMNLKALVFHWVHSRNIILERNRCMATRKQGARGLAYIFTARPLPVEEKIIVNILETDPSSEENLIFGVTSCDPANIKQEEMPTNCDDLLDRSEYWVVWRERNSYSNGDIIACNINSDGELQVSRNGEPLSTVLYVDHTLPLWFFFDLCGAVCKIQLIGSTNVLPDLKLELIEKSSKALNVSLPASKPLASEQGNSVSEDNMCGICYDKPANSVLYQCGHMCCCYDCAMEVFKRGSQCPVCRAVIEDVIKVFR